MGLAIVTAGGATGLYDITIEKNPGKSNATINAFNARLIKIASEISTVTTAITAAEGAVLAAIAARDEAIDKFKAGTGTRAQLTEKQVAVMQAEAALFAKRRDLSVLKIEDLSIREEQGRIVISIEPESRTGVWCADLTEDIAAGTNVGTAEVNGEDTQIIILPEGTTTGALGKLQPAGVMTGAGVFVNRALFPCWQKWRPTYRIGTILDIDYDNDTCDVGIKEQRSREQGLSINQDGTVWNPAAAAVSGFEDYASRNPNDPLVTETGDTQLTMTPALKADLEEVNNTINNRNSYRKDTEQYDKLEYWDTMHPGGSGDCVANYEEIYTESGVKKVGELKVGDVVLSYDLQKKQYVYKPIIKIWEKGLLPGVRVGLKNGLHVDISESHPMWARTNQGWSHGNQKISEYKKIYFKDIDLNKWWKRRLPIAKKLPYEIKDIDWLTEDICFVIGHYLAEGWSEGSHVCSSGYDMPEHVYPILNRNKIPYAEYKNNSGVPCIRFLKSKFKTYLKGLKANSFEIHLPEDIFHLPENKMKSIMDGFWLGDGHNGNYPQKNGNRCNKQEVYSTSSSQWAMDLQRIGLQLGQSFHVWKQEHHQGAGDKPIYRITHNENSFFYRHHGYDGLSEIGIARKHIEDIGLVEMRDFEVADTHTFIFKNGLVCHQCEDFALTKAHALLAKGYPASAIKIEVGKTKDGTGHAWLVVQTDKGDMVLDINYKNVMPASAVNYNNRRRQTGRNWVSSGVRLYDVPIEYMDGSNAEVFVVGDNVLVSFVGQDWDDPKVIGFETNPRAISHGLYVKAYNSAGAFVGYVALDSALEIKHTFSDTIEELPLVGTRIGWQTSPNFPRLVTTLDYNINDFTEWPDGSMKTLHLAWSYSQKVYLDATTIVATGNWWLYDSVQESPAEGQPLEDISWSSYIDRIEDPGSTILAFRIIDSTHYMFVYTKYTQASSMGGVGPEVVSTYININGTDYLLFETPEVLDSGTSIVSLNIYNYEGAYIYAAGVRSNLGFYYIYKNASFVKKEYTPIIPLGIVKHHELYAHETHGMLYAKGEMYYV